MDISVYSDSDVWANFTDAAENKGYSVALTMVLCVAGQADKIYSSHTRRRNGRYFWSAWRYGT